ncbi:MAG: histidinol-phosphatase [Candidatus Brockarchaeota archaeon]|nr:histidinol-phosphatase [Candidatus Brockarchaeota archaeon]
MIRWTLHTHTVVSDGELTEEELVRGASEEGLEGLAITDHYPYPCYPVAVGGIDWATSHRALALQIKSIEYLRSRYSDITILTGAEAEFVEGLNVLERWMHDLDLDFVLGGVHLVGGWALDWSEEEFLKGITHFGSLESAFARYFEAVEELADSGIVDSIAHLDVVKKYNAGERYFSERSPWYPELVERCLRRISKANVAIEVSTAGLRKPVGSLYPSGWILKEARELGIEVTVGTDCHKMGEKVGEGLDRAEEALRSAGYERYLVFRGRKPEEVLLT